MFCTNRRYSLEPIFHVIQQIHRNGIHHGNLLRVILENDDHVKILEMKLDTFKVNELDIVECNDERRLRRRDRMDEEIKDVLNKRQINRQADICIQLTISTRITPRYDFHLSK